MTSDAYRIIGERLGSLGLPTVIVQEGGYSLAAVAERRRRSSLPFAMPDEGGHGGELGSPAKKPVIFLVF